MSLRRLRAVLTVLCCVCGLAAGPARAQDSGGQPDDHFMCYKVRSSRVDICADGSANEGAICTDDADCGGVADTCVTNKLSAITTVKTCDARSVNAGAICTSDDDCTGEKAECGARRTITLEDGFDGNGPVAHTVVKPSVLCPPADKDEEGVVDADTHLVGYKIKLGKGEAKHERRTGLQVMNQFGIITLDTVKQDRLLVPASKDLAGPVAAPASAAHNVDHYKCYKTKVTKGTPKFSLATAVPVNDQFENELYAVSKPTRLCRAVDKNGEGIKNAVGHLLCYKVKPAPGADKHSRRIEVYTNDQLAPGVFDTIRQSEMCVPSAILEATAGCEPLNGTECLLPYPSTAYMVDDPSTASGVRVNLPLAGLPELNGAPLLVEPFNARDGFSPTAQILMHFQQGVDPVQSDASRLLEPGCCGQPAGPPWIDTRTYDGRSLDLDSPTLLFDADTGEQILHFIEPDSRAAGSPARQVLVMRPGASLEPGTRYIVAMRNLKTAAGEEVLAEAPFLALRDGIVTDVPELEARRQYFEDEIFAPLATFGVDRSELVLAFDFITASDDQLTHQILTMRDEAYTWLDAVDQSPMTMPFAVDTIDENDCGVAGTVVWRRVKGTFDSPLFLDADIADTGPQFMNTDGDDNPVQNGFTHPNFTISIPCKVLDPLEGVSRPVVLGHGLFQNGSLIEALITPVVSTFRPDVNYIAGATDWRGLSSFDLAWLASHVIGLGASRLHDFEALPDRLSQGMLNTLVLARMMKLGLFNRDPAFEKPGGQGVFPGPGEEMYYYGISLGGIMGSWLAALTPDIERFGLDVPGMNFSCLLQRASPFSSFEALLPGIGLTDPMETILGYGILHDIWVSAEPAGYMRHVTTDRLPGSGAVPPRLLMTPAWLDKQVSNMCTEIQARTLGIPNLAGASIHSSLQGIPDVAGPLDSAYVMWDAGSFDLFNPAHEPFIPPLANEIPSTKCDPHPERPLIPAAIDMLVDFLEPGGVITNTCTGLCDGSIPDEIPLGAAAPCDPLN